MDHTDDNDWLLTMTEAILGSTLDCSKGSRKAASEAGTKSSSLAKLSAGGGSSGEGAGVRTLP